MNPWTAYLLWLATISMGTTQVLIGLAEGWGS